MKKYDVCIIGGGAAGMTAAVSIDREISVCILEKNKVPGKKLMATGGGRCNITNKACEYKDTTLDFFKCLGLETYCDEQGRYYPYSNQASDVVKLLVDAAAERGADIMTETQILRVSRDGDTFHITDAKGRVTTASEVILACGGKAAPQFGTTGDGYAIAKALGHNITRVYPILTGIECGDFRKLKGVRAKGIVRLYKDDSPVVEEQGEIQFTEDGISGICVFDITPYIKAEEGEHVSQALDRYHVELDLAPDFTEEALRSRRSTFGILSEKLSAAVDTSRIKCWKLPVKGIKGWKNAQCTAGGVSLAHINEETMESELVPGLYFAGEVLDIQGPCGGYNLQNAWETGMKAAAAINKSYGKRR